MTGRVLAAAAVLACGLHAQPATRPAAGGRPPGPRLELRSVPVPGGGVPFLQGGGVPLPPGTGLVRPEHATVTDASDRPLAADVRILARYPAGQAGPGEARWVHVAVTSDPERPGRPVYLRPHADDDVPPEPVAADEVRVDAGGTVVELGDGAPVLVRSLAAGAAGVALDLVLELTDEKGHVHAFHPGAPRVEHRGPASARLAWAGPLGPDLRATVRLTAVRESPLVALEIRVENPGPMGIFKGLPEKVVYFDDLSLVLRTRTPWKHAFDGTRRTSLPAVVDLPVADVSQKDFDRNLVWASKSPDGEVRGLSHPGVVSVGRDDATLLIVRPHARFEAPNRFALRPREARVHLLPEGGSGPHYKGQYGHPRRKGDVDPRSLEHYRFEGGRWKTFRVGLMPAPPEHVPEGTTAALQATLEHPPALLPAPPWTPELVEPGFLVAPFEERPDDASVARYQRMLRILVDDRAASSVPGLGRIGLPALLRRGGTYGGSDPYGWFNFGDVPWAEGYSSLHYDLPRTLLACFLASGGERAFLDRGSIMARHQRDVDMIHSDPPEQFRGGQRYEKGWWHGNAYIPVPSHHWLTGLFLFHVLTGDPGTRATLAQARDYVLRQDTHRWHGKYGGRWVGWPLDNLVTLWMLDGDERLVERARGTIRRFEELEQRDGGEGYVLNPSSADPRRGLPRIHKSWMQAIFLAATCRYVRATGDRGPLPLVRRMADHLAREVYIAPSGSTPARVWEMWAPGGYRKNASVHLTWVVLDGLAHAALVLDDHALLRVSEEMFASVTRFHQWGPGLRRASFGDASSWSPIAARMQMFPGTESKILGNIGRFGMAFPAVRRLMRE